MPVIFSGEIATTYNARTTAAAPTVPEGFDEFYSSLCAAETENDSEAFLERLFGVLNIETKPEHIAYWQPQIQVDKYAATLRLCKDNPILLENAVAVLSRSKLSMQ